ncbi:MAG: lysine-2,3-aminomutase-like protein [Hyphomicrobiaceae bacterium]
MTVARTLRSAEDLVEAGLITAEGSEDIAAVGARYAIAITPTMADLINRHDPADPIARQFVPDVRELKTLPQEREDPIGDHPHSPVPGIVHRYNDRVLLKLAHICPVYCRFCFRREMVGPNLGHALSGEEFERALAYVVDNPQIWEVIVTGGDPLMLSPRRIAQVTDALADIAHVKIVRWHTRVPVVDPGRITPELIAAMRTRGKRIVVAIHTNHSTELTPQSREAIARLEGAGFGLLSQTVLLKGINDHVDTLETLMRTLVSNGVKPYYLHHGDLAPGTAHLRTGISEGKALMNALRTRLSGIALPTYVLDIPGGHGKVEIEANVTDLGDGRFSVRDPSGVLHVYHDRDAQSG